MAADTRIETNPLNYFAGVKPLHLGIGVQFVEIAHPQGQIGVGEQLDSLSLGAAHENYRNLLLESRLTHQSGKLPCLFLQKRVAQLITDNDARRVKIVIQCLALTQEFRGENDVGNHNLDAAVRLTLAIGKLFAHPGRITDRHGGFYNHDRIRIDCKHLFHHILHGGGVKKVLAAVVIGGGGYHHKIRITVRLPGIQSGMEIQLLVRQIFFNIIVLNGGFASVDHLHTFRNNVHRRHMVAL